ncbi:MAG: SsrA-binding protein SmpB [Deltaproteobacteria bacterium]|nr:SsrA-binding protein SmpB [Deltaproteobacteria bacterium]MCB9788828.1 SsrA-binding protein SmpB [Deltaproteobacteria bacterium]
MGSRTSDKNNRTLATNRRARHEYQIDETFQAGLSLMGSEVKSLRASQVTFSDGHVEPRDGSLWLVNVHIPEYAFANRHGHEPTRARRLLLEHREIERIAERVDEKGFTCIPLRFYLDRGLIKLELGLARGKKHADRRQDLKERDAKREMDRALKQ